MSPETTFQKGQVGTGGVFGAPHCSLLLSAIADQWSSDLLSEQHVSSERLYPEIGIAIIGSPQFPIIPFEFFHLARQLAYPRFTSFRKFLRCYFPNAEEKIIEYVFNEGPNRVRLIAFKLNARFFEFTATSQLQVQFIRLPNRFQSNKRRDTVHNRISIVDLDTFQ
ncbi:MAG: hypothetical protein ACK5YR_18380 [Pirellula sp.]